MSEKSRSITGSGDFQWITGSGEAGSINPETKPTQPQSWFSKSDPGGDPIFSSANPYVASNGKQLSYEESRKQEWPVAVPPTPPQPNFVLPTENRVFIVGNQQPQQNLPRSNSIPGHPQAMHAINMAHQRQSMPNLLHPSRPANHSRMIISSPQAHLPPLIAQHPQGAAILQRRPPQPNQPPNRRMSNHPSPNVMQNRFVQPQRFRMAPQQVQQMRRTILQPQPGTATVMIPQNSMQHFLLQRQAAVQAAKVLHPRNGNVNLPPTPQSLIQYNKPTAIMMNQPTAIMRSVQYSHHLTQQQQAAHQRNHLNGHRNAHRKNHGRNKHINHQGNARQNESSKNSNKFTSVLKPVKHDKLVHDSGSKSKSNGSQTKNLLDYDHRLAYHMHSSGTSNRPPLKLDSNSNPRAPRSEHAVQKDVSPVTRNSGNTQAKKRPRTWTELFQSAALAKHITKYLSLHEFLNVFGVLSKALHVLIPNIGWVESIVITFGDKIIIFNNDIHLPFFDSKELVRFLKVLSSISIRHLKLQIEEYSENIPFEFFKSYFGGSQVLQTIAVNATNTEEASSRKWQHFLIDLDFEHLAIENKPFLLDDWFVKKLAIKALTISSPDYPMTLSLVNNLPNTVKAISICRPSFSISKLLEKVEVTRIYIRNPSRKPPLEPTDLEALFRKVNFVELDFSLLGEIINLKILKSELKVQRLIFVSDGTSPSLVQRAKAMLSSSAIDVSIKWTIID